MNYKLNLFISTLIILLLGTNQTLAQELDINKIDTSNYYDYSAFNGRLKYLKGKKLSEAFLKKHEVLLIIEEELKKEKINNIQNHVIYELNNKENIVLDTYCPKENVGFIYIEIFNGVSKESRKLKSPYRRFFDIDYQETHYNINGTSKLIEIEKTPSNILILQADNYWFQFTEVKDDNKYLITKEIAEKILRMDIEKYISNKNY